MSKIKLLDLCCKAGGASAGYELGAKDLGIEIEITGVDLDNQPNYPYNFIQDDALDFLNKHGKEFTHIHISPPCQPFSPSTSQFRNNGKRYRDINIDTLRKKLTRTGKRCVIENVMQSPLYANIVLTGTMFGLKVIRKRKFELVNWWQMSPLQPERIGTVKNGDYVSIFGKASWRKAGNEVKKPDWRKNTIRETWAYAMGINHHMTDVEISEAIPPAYTRYISQEFFK